MSTKANHHSLMLCAHATFFVFFFYIENALSTRILSSRRGALLVLTKQAVSEIFISRTVKDVVMAETRLSKTRDVEFHGFHNHS